MNLTFQLLKILEMCEQKTPEINPSEDLQGKQTAAKAATITESSSALLAFHTSAQRTQELCPLCGETRHDSLPSSVKKDFNQFKQWGREDGREEEGRKKGEREGGRERTPKSPSENG